MLNQNYPRCIFIRTDCEIWAVKTRVIVALETDITHFPSRSWQWHANFVFRVCVFLCRPFVYMCQGSEERGRTSFSVDRRGGERWEFIIKQYGPPPHTLPLASDPGLCPLWLPYDVCLETIFPGTEKKIHIQRQWNNGCTGAVSTEINPALQSLCRDLWVQICFWPWARFGRTLCSGYWIAIMAPLQCIIGMLSVMKNRSK